MQLKIFHIRKQSEPPFQSSKEEILSIAGKHIVLEHYFYEMEFIYQDLPHLVNIRIDGELIDPVFIQNFENQGFVRVSVAQHFSNKLGYVKINFNDEEFWVRVDASKLNSKELAKVFSFLYDKNKPLILSYLEGNMFSLDAVKRMVSMTNLSSIGVFQQSMEKLFYAFSKNPIKRVKKEIVIKPYREVELSDYSIDWLMTHLDEIVYDPSFINHPEAIKIGNKYGMIHSIATEESYSDFNSYENEIILGGFSRAFHILHDIEVFLENILQSQFSQEEDDVATYDTVRTLICRKSNDELQVLKNRLINTERKYHQLFKGVRARLEWPRFSGHIISKPHYTEAYQAILQICQLDVQVKGQGRPFNISYLDQIYESYNYYLILDTLKEILGKGEQEIEERHLDGYLYKCVTFRNEKPNQEWILNFLYNPVIEKRPKDTSLVLQGKISKENNHFTPDFVLEFSNRHDIRYAIFDAKYKNAKTVVEQDIKDAALKYYTCLRVSGARKDHQKPDFLYLICPDSYYSQNYWSLNYDESFLPLIGVICCKPYNTGSMHNTLSKIAKKWGLI